ncbi:fas-binding factor 1 homolog isoform X2 [Cololabis saira]|uniref:fas-binding factor 1 homolog isoform X2 n=1 Tax=Cololabis saira TaxID=129043 RepID=UPI002AD239A1|nr:fas-binding factor 1 homolog isoform X2 [Cololabis saira]
MASKTKAKASESLFGDDDDLLDSLFDNRKQPVRSKGIRAGPQNHSFASDNLFSRMAEEVKQDGLDFEDSDVSGADPSDILKDMKNMDDMEADLFTSEKKPSSAPAQTKPLGNQGPKKDPTVFEKNANPEGADKPSEGGKKPNSPPPSTTRSYKKFTFSDDPLDDLLPDETKPQPKSRQTTHEKPVSSASASPILKQESKKATKKGVLSFNEDPDDLMDALGFDSDNNNPKKKESPLWSNKERSDVPQRPRTKINDILESFTSPRLLERPPTGEMKEQLQSQEKQQERISTAKEDELTFGSYQPTLGSTPEGRQSRRQSVRFSTDDVSASTSDTKPKPSVSLRHRNSADWLGLKVNDEPSYIEDGPKKMRSAEDSPKIPSSPLLEKKSSFNGSQSTSVAKMPADDQADTKPTQSEGQRVQPEEEEDDWLAGALSRKKALALSNTEARTSKQDKPSVVSIQDISQTPSGKEETFPSIKELRPAAHSTPVREEQPNKDPIPSLTSAPPQSLYTAIESTPTVQHDLLPSLTSSRPNPPRPQVDSEQTLSLFHPSDSPGQVTRPPPASVSAISPSQPHPFPSSNGSVGLKEASQAANETLQQPSFPGAWPPMPPGTFWLPQQSLMQNTSVPLQQQVAFTTDNLQQLLQQQQTLLPGPRGVCDAATLQKLKEQSEDYQSLQARIMELEGQVKTLKLERDQSQMMLENIQHRHKQDMEFMESTHKARVKLLEEAAAQRENRLRLECEDLMERLATLTRSAEEERSALQAQYHRKVAQAQQDRDQEVERLRDLQRKSILEMKKDHEDQIQRLKRLKEEEIDAVTSATTQTRSLAGVIEQMEHFSSRLGELSSRVESTHQHTTHGLEQGARHRDEQLQTMQDRLARQQKAMDEEKAYLKEIISRMDSQLNEQQRQLEKERWKVTAETAKAESLQRGLEEERRVLNMQSSMEREELERAKSTLLDEQKLVMQHCAEERRKLAAEWNHFHAQEKHRHERAEREVNSLLERREGSIISLAQEQADLKLHTAELKQKEMAVAQERETLDRRKEELEREKEKISSTALRLKTRAQEVEAFSKLAAEKYEEGEQALQESKGVEATHEARLRNIQSQTEHLRQQEQRILKERMQLSHHQQDTEMLRQNSSSSPLPVFPTPVLPDPELTSTPNILPNYLGNSQSMALEASLALWRYTAQKDHEFLEEEKIFLENLKKKSYRLTKD